MQVLYTRQQARAHDRYAQQSLGLPTLVLMENAGHGAAYCIREHFRKQLKHLCLVGGVGQNGGDAWVVGRHLHGADVVVDAVCVGDIAKVSGDALVNLRALQGLGVTVRSFDPSQPLASAQTDVIVDGIFGTGLNKVIEDPYKLAIAAINEHPAPTVSLDLPSGIDANTGAMWGTGVQADLTITFGAPKRGLFQWPGAGHAGKVQCASIGVQAVSCDTFLLESVDLYGALPARARNAHKGNSGRVCIVAGNEGTEGAAWLAARGAFRAGASMVVMLTRGRPHAAPGFAEVMVHALDENPEGQLEHWSNWADAFVVGPGLGVDGVCERAVRYFTEQKKDLPCVFDADALNVMSQGASTWARCSEQHVLTPHPGEAARLLEQDVLTVQADRHAAIEQLVARFQAQVVLKGAGTIIAATDGKQWVSPVAHPALATAGSGDVLAGMIGSLQAQGLCASRAGYVATLWHASAAAAIAGERDRGLLAHEIADALGSCSHL